MLTNCSLCVYKTNRETALLERIMQQSEMRDSEDKVVMSQDIVSMELVRMKSKHEVPPFDREILNENLHFNSVSDVWDEKDGIQEFLALGMSKGSIYLVHVKKLHQLYCRFTVHREAVSMIRYLPHSQTFVSCSSEHDMVFWKVDKINKRIQILSEFIIGRQVINFNVLND